ncbi:MAG: hypothetical protein ACREMO_12240 [Gemmatimonadales bacterium]
MLRDLITATILREAGPDRYFPDDTVWQARRRKARTVPINMAVLAILAAVILKTQMGW